MAYDLSWEEKVFEEATRGVLTVRGTAAAALAAALEEGRTIMGVVVSRRTTVATMNPHGEESSPCLENGCGSMHDLYDSNSKLVIGPSGSDSNHA